VLGLSSKHRSTLWRGHVDGLGVDEGIVVLDDPCELAVGPVEVGRQDSEPKLAANWDEFGEEGQEFVNQVWIKFVTTHLCRHSTSLRRAHSQPRNVDEYDMARLSDLALLQTTR
jgi:hypothetical protein